MGREIDEGEGRRIALRTRWPAALAFLVSLMAVGCADNGTGSDTDKRDGFYGGISGGGTWP